MYLLCVTGLEEKVEALSLSLFVSLSLSLCSYIWASFEVTRVSRNVSSLKHFVCAALIPANSGTREIRETASLFINSDVTLAFAHSHANVSTAFACQLWCVVAHKQNLDEALGL